MCSIVCLSVCDVCVYMHERESSLLYGQYVYTQEVMGKVDVVMKVMDPLQKGR